MMKMSKNSAKGSLHLRGTATTTAAAVRTMIMIIILNMTMDARAAATTVSVVRLNTVTMDPTIILVHLTTLYRHHHPATVYRTTSQATQLHSRPALHATCLRRPAQALASTLAPCRPFHRRHPAWRGTSVCTLLLLRQA